MNNAKYLRERSKEICQLNNCTEDEHFCECYAYISHDGNILDICSSDYFQGSSEPYAAISLPWDGNEKQLKEEIKEQCPDVIKKPRPKKLRTKQQYLELFDNPNYLFGQGTKVILFPNGVHEIWIQNLNGTKGFSISASEGPVGFAVTVKTFAGTPDATLLNTIAADYSSINVDGVRETSLVQYNIDEKSQAFKRWYMADSSDKEEKEQLAKECKRLGVF